MDSVIDLRCRTRGREYLGKLYQLNDMLAECRRLYKDRSACTRRTVFIGLI